MPEAGAWSTGTTDTKETTMRALALLAALLCLLNGEWGGAAALGFLYLVMQGVYSNWEERGL